MYMYSRCSFLRHARCVISTYNLYFYFPTILYHSVTQYVICTIKDLLQCHDCSTWTYCCTLFSLSCDNVLVWVLLWCFTFSSSHLCEGTDILRSAICTGAKTAWEFYCLWINLILFPRFLWLKRRPVVHIHLHTHTRAHTLMHKRLMIFLKWTKQFSKACSIKVLQLKLRSL